MLSHRIDLVERHEISVELPYRPGEFVESFTVNRARVAALDWAEQEGLMIDPTPFQRHPNTVGVSFEVTVVRAVAEPADEPFQWRWSVRWRDWLRKFSVMSAAAQRAPTHPSVQALP